MSTALSVILLIAVVLVVGLLRDSFRTKAVTRWALAYGLKPVPKEQHDNAQLVAWAQRFHPDTAGHWGIVLRGETAGFDTAIAEHEERRMTSKARWHSLAVTRVPGLRMDAIRITRAGSKVVRDVLDAAVAPGRAVEERLGIDVTKRPAVHPVGQGKWAVMLENEDALAFWSSEPQAEAIDAWPHDAELAAAGDYVLVRMPGLIDAARLDDVLACAGAARAFFTQAAERQPVTQ